MSRWFHTKKSRRKEDLRCCVSHDARSDYAGALDCVARTLAAGEEPHKNDKRDLCKAVRILEFCGFTDWQELNGPICEKHDLAQLAVYLDWKKGTIVLQHRGAWSQDYVLGFIA